jgi:16S rRNA C967 or C1407 C5-methylase (RsmB/RsmF family)/NOL1/NOP2/fmu family ribosome biogenesis protein
LKNLPPQLLSDLQGVPGFDEVQLLNAHTQPAVTSVRLNPFKRTDVFADAEQVPWCADGRYLHQRPVFTLDPFYHAGAYYVQEASSMFLDHMIRQLLPDRNGLRVLDLCAAPGGKSTLIASLLGKDSLLVSNEVIRTRASILEENISRWGCMNNWVCSNDPKDIGRLTGYFDVIVVDAPCSGSGLFRKDERALDEWSEANVTLCSQRQQRILADVWPSLKEGGILVYATCSYSPQEDEEILKWLKDEFDVSGLVVELQEEWGVVATSSENDMPGYRFFPGKVKGEGFFIAAMRKNKGTHLQATSKSKPIHDKRLWEEAAHLLQQDSYTCFQHNKESCYAINPLHEADYQLLSKLVYLRKPGLELGMPSAKDWLPAHDVALSIDKNIALPSIEVSKEQALHFLKKEVFEIPPDVKGWSLINYNGLALGWIKALGNRFNNYLPKHWRIRMDIGDADWQ